MALNYGLGLYETDKAKAAASTKYYKEKIEPVKYDKNFYHNRLPWILVIVDIGEVSEKYIPIIENRYAYICHDSYVEIVRELDPMSFQVYLKRFIGFRVNVNTLSTTEYIKKRVQVMKNQLKTLTDQEIEEERSKG